MALKDDELHAIVTNEIEWRKTLWKKVEHIEQKQIAMSHDVGGFKTSITIFGSIFGALSGIIASFIGKKL